MGLIKSAEAPVTVAAFSMVDIEQAARKILLRARFQAERILVEAQKEGELLRQQAKAEGFASGRAEGLTIGKKDGQESGHAQALEEYKKQLSELVTALSSTLMEFDQQRDDPNTRGITEVVDLACSVARRVTRRQGVTDPKVLEENLKEAMGLAVHAVDVRIAVHPSQFRTMQHEMPRLKLNWPQLKHVEIIQDTELTPGSVKVFTNSGIVDGELETKLDCVIAEVMAQDPSAAGHS
jgi:flagellar assembly protein FliH